MMLTQTSFTLFKSPSCTFGKKNVISLQFHIRHPLLSTGASDLIRSMLTVSASKRASIEDICSHWWVNEGYLESCLDVAEALANQTPVRLDLLLSLAPKHINSEHMLIQPEEEDSARVSGGGLFWSFVLLWLIFLLENEDLGTQRCF